MVPSLALAASTILTGIVGDRPTLLVALAVADITLGIACIPFLMGVMS